MSDPARHVGKAVVAALLTLGAPESGAEPTAVQEGAVVAGDSRCPRPEAVWRALQELAAPGVLEQRQPGPIVVVSDFGESYRVSVAGRSRDYPDPARDCTKRAQVAAVFVALVLNVPEPEARSETPSPPSSSARPPSVSPVRPRSDDAGLAAWVDLAAQMALGYREGVLHDLYGTSLHVSAGTRPGPGWPGLAGVLGGAAHLPFETRYGPLTVTQRRYRVDLAVRLTVAARPAELAVDLGPTLDVSHFESAEVPLTDDQTHRTLGVRFAGLARLQSRGPLAPHVGLFTELYPEPFSLHVRDLGTVGQTPRWWLGAALGLTWNLL